MEKLELLGDWIFLVSVGFFHVKFYFLKFRLVKIMSFRTLFWGFAPVAVVLGGNENPFPVTRNLP